MYIPDTVMAFVIKDSPLESELPPVINPAYIYEVGDLINFSDVLNEELRFQFKVTKVAHELEQSLINTDQTIVIYLQPVG